MGLSKRVYLPLFEDYFLNCFWLRKQHCFIHPLCLMSIIGPHGFDLKNCLQYSSAMEKVTEHPNVFCG
jgi:hypothetical protein